MNRIDPDFFLGGRNSLNREKAYQAIKEKIAEPLGLEVLEAAEGICNIVDSKMEETLRTTLGAKGIDPEGKFWIPLTAVHIGHCRGVDYDLWLEFDHGFDNGRRVGDVVLGQIQAEKLPAGQCLLKGRAQLAFMASDDNAHGVPPPSPLRLSRSPG